MSQNSSYRFNLCHHSGMSMRTIWNYKCYGYLWQVKNVLFKVHLIFQKTAGVTQHLKKTESQMSDSNQESATTFESSIKNNKNKKIQSTKKRNRTNQQRHRNKVTVVHPCMDESSHKGKHYTIIWTNTDGWLFCVTYQLI